MKLWLRVPLVKSDDATSEGLVRRLINVIKIFDCSYFLCLLDTACVYMPFKPIHINEYS